MTPITRENLITDKVLNLMLLLFANGKTIGALSHLLNLKKIPYRGYISVLFQKHGLIKLHTIPGRIKSHGSESSITWTGGQPTRVGALQILQEARDMHRIVVTNSKSKHRRQPIETKISTKEITSSVTPLVALRKHITDMKQGLMSLGWSAEDAITLIKQQIH